MAVFRWLVAGATALAVVGVVGYRVLAPHDTLTVAQRPYPAAEVAPFLRIGVLTSAPLIVDNRIRVYAEKSRVWADSPVSSRTQLSPFWAYRRWPAALVGVMAVESVPVVVSRWSDGALVALDARTGRVAWRSRISPGGRYTGRRTGSATVYSPVGLYTARSAADGTPVVVADGRAFDARTGRPLWTVPRGCDTWTTATAYVVADCARDAELRKLPLTFRVLGSTKKFTRVLPRSAGTFLISRVPTSLKASAVSRRKTISSAESSRMPRKSFRCQRVSDFPGAVTPFPA